MKIVKSTLYPWEDLNKLMNEEFVPETDQEAIISSQLTQKERASDDLFKQAQSCVIAMNSFCHQRKQSGTSDIAEVDFLEPQPSHCCFLAPYGSTCLGTMCKMKSMNIIDNTLITLLLI